MRVFVKFYPIVDTIHLDIEPSASIGAFKQRLFEHTNLEQGDKLKVIVKNVPMPSDDVTLWDLEIKEDTTFHVVVQEQTNGPFKINVPHTLGALDALNEVAIAHVLSFLDVKEIVLGTSSACRKFRTVENQQQHIVWKPLASKAIQQHVRDEHKVKLSEFMANKKKANFKQLFLYRWFRSKIWRKIKELSLVPQHTDEQYAAKFEKEKQIKVKREPRPLSEEEEQFLQENDANVLRRNLRKDKTAREKLRRHTVIQQKKTEIESGVWKVVPQEYNQFDYDTLMGHSFGLHPQNNPDGVTGLYDNNGRFLFFSQEGKLLYLADIEPEDDSYRFKNVVVDEADERDPKDVIEHFFKLFAQCKTRKEEEKKLLEIRITETGLKNFEGDAVADVLLVAKKYDGNVKSEKPKIEVKKPKPDEQDAQITLQATQFVYKPNSDEENEASDAVNNSNITETYAALFTSAHKDDDVAVLGFQALEHSLLKKLGRDADENSKSLIGKLLARGVTQFVKENNFTVKNDLQEQSESADPEESSGKKTKKALEKLVVLVKDQAEADLVKLGISTEFDLNQ
jgi:hypothetical protein